MFISNKLQIRYQLSREFLQTTQALGIPATAGLRLRQAYADAAGQGTVVWRLGPGAEEAANEMNTLLMELYAVSGKEKHERSIANG